MNLELFVVPLAVGSMFGPASAVLMRLFGSHTGIAIGLAVLALETLLPAVLAVRTFRRRDW